MRTPVLKTWKLYVGGAFPRSESGRAWRVTDAAGKAVAEISHASRKDLRDAVEAAATAQPGWWSRTAYNRGQILHRMAEMAEGRRDELIAALRATRDVTKREAAREVDASIDRLVAFAGWTDKFTTVLGGQNPVAAPFYNFTTPEPTGVVVAFVPDEPPLLALVSLVAPCVAAGNAVVAIVPPAHALAALVLAEAMATSDLPGGVVNVLTAPPDELASHVAAHRGIDAVAGANLDPALATTLRGGAAENLKRVRLQDLDPEDWYDTDRCESPWTIEPFVEMKTIWHPER